MPDNDLRTVPAGTAKSAENAVPAPQISAEEQERQAAEHRYLAELVERAVEAKLHNYELPTRRFSRRAFKLAREAFRLSAYKVENAECPQLLLEADDLRRLAKVKLGDVGEGTISSDITLLNKLADTPEGTTGFLSPFINTSRGPRQVRLFLLSERAEHSFSFEVLDEENRVVIRRTTAEVRIGQTLEDVTYAEVMRNARLRLRLMRGAAAVLVLVLGYAILPKEAKAAIRNFANEHIVQPIKRLLTGGGTPAGANLDVSAEPEGPPARVIEDRPRLRLTPAMYWNGGTVYGSGLCDERNTPFVFVHAEHKSGPAKPPFVLLRNGIVIRDKVMERVLRFDDRDVLPGRSYTYALGKRDPASGQVSVGHVQTAFTPRCGASQFGRAPVVGFIVDPPSGTAPITMTFQSIVSDDEPIDRPLAWDFGDGSPPLFSDKSEVTHEYKHGGEYMVIATLSDKRGNVGQEQRTISVIGPPPPPHTGLQDPHLFWHGDPRARVSQIVGDVDHTFEIEMLPARLMEEAEGRPVSYRWVFGDCIEGEAPFRGPAAKIHKDCFVGPFSEPLMRRKFDGPGLYPVMVEVTKDNGDVSFYPLGQLTVLPTEAWYSKQNDPAHARLHWEAQRKAAGE